MPLKFTVSGLRGVWGDGIDIEVITSYTKSFINYLSNFSNLPKKIVIGRDTRKTSPLISDLVSSIFRAYGYEVFDLGVCTTPLTLFAVRKLDAVGGIVITASHNPPEWNALKFVDKGGKFINENTVNFIQNTVNSQKPSVSEWSQVGKKKDYTNILDLFIEEINKAIDVDVIRKKKFRVGFDPVNGAAAKLGIKFLEYLGCEVVAINIDEDSFPGRPTEPVGDALMGLSKVVTDNNCDVGFATDPDGDRLAIVSEEGNILGEEYTLPLAEMSAIEYLYSEKFSKNIVINMSTSSLSDYIAGKYGFKVIRSKVGEANVVSEISKNNAFIGGEGNGGVIFPLLNTARDSFVGISLVLLLIAKNCKKLSEIVSELPNLKMLKKKVEGVLDKESIQKLIDHVSSTFGSYEKNEIDGAWFGFESGWIHIRESNTEPITRIIFEGTNKFVDFVSRELEKSNLVV
jgi:phosphomannomutase